MRTLGIDLGAEPRRTAAAVVEWSQEAATVVHVAPSADDDELVALAVDADKVGIDCPLGWPDAFLAFVSDHRDGRLPPRAVDAAERQPLRYRATDLALLAAKQGVPLSVSSDLIGVPAMRAAGLLAQLADARVAVDRSGLTGAVVEAYPAAALRRWGLLGASYKGRARVVALDALVDRLTGAFVELDLGPHETICRELDDAFDAVVCALIARAAAAGLTASPPSELMAQARREGWIAVPSCDRPSDLLG